MMEQVFNAYRVEQLGLCRRLSLNNLTAERLRAAIDEVAADEVIRANPTAMQRELHYCGGTVAGAEALERYTRCHDGFQGYGKGARVLAPAR